VVTIADQLVDWGALGDVILISAIAGLAIATTLGIGIVASLRAQDHKGGSALALNAVTVVAVVLVAAAIAVGIYYITDK
jgi:Na+/melibiose symporter-like transporter